MFGLRVGKLGSLSSILGGAISLPPTLSIADAAADETAGNVVFTVTLSEAVAGNVTFDAATSDGTATAGSDYTAVVAGVGEGSKTILAGNTSATITVPISTDLLQEGSETFTVTLSNLVTTDGVVFGTTVGTGTITDVFTPVQLQVEDNSG